MMISPEEDPNWPICLDHFDKGDKHWCELTRADMLVALDGESISPGTRVLVPIVPEYDIYAEVSLDVTLLAGIMCGLALVKETDAFSLDEELIPLGLHTLGEGRFVISSTIQAWMEGFEPLRCEYHNHSYKQEMEYEQGKYSAVFKKANRACLTMYGKCYPCWRHESQGGILQSGVQLNAGYFGLDNTVTEPRGSSGGVRNSLNARFGK